MSKILLGPSIFELAETYKPIVYFHSREPYFPGTTADYIRNSMLMHNDEIILEDINDPNIIVSPEIGTDGSWYISLKDEEDTDTRRGAEWFVKGNDVNKYLYPETPSFEFYAVNGSYEIYGNYTDIVYTLTYPYNGTLSPHTYDEELCIIRFKNGVPDMVGLSAHGGYDWRPWQWVEKDGKRPIIFSAKESHAFYFEPKNYHRIFGFGSDLTDRGYRVDNLDLLYTPWKLEELPENVKFLAFPGGRAKDVRNMNFAPRNRPSIYGPRHTSVELIEKTIQGNIYNGILFALLILLITYTSLTYFDFKDGNLYFEVGQSVVGMVFFILVGVLFTLTFNST